MVETLRVPQERIGVILGTKGETRKLIEKKAKVKLRIDPDGQVEVSGKEAYAEYKARDVIKAIARGFNPDVALQLLGEDYYLKLIDLNEIGGSDRSIQRLKGRVIGAGGKARRIMEETTEARISVYGNTIGIIGLLDEVELASLGIEKLIEGKSHAYVYAMLERGRRKMKEGRMLHMWGPREEAR